MLIIGTIVFLITIFLGYRVLQFFLHNQAPPKKAVMTHGAFALLGIGLLTSYVVFGEHYDNLVIGSLVLFCLAAVGGITMVVMGMKKMTPPRAFLFFHPLIAVSAFILLIIYVAQQYLAA